MIMLQKSFQQYLESTNVLINDDFDIHKRQKTSVKRFQFLKSLTCQKLLEMVKPRNIHVLKTHSTKFYRTVELSKSKISGCKWTTTKQHSQIITSTNKKKVLQENADKLL